MFVFGLSKAYKLMKQCLKTSIFNYLESQIYNLLSTLKNVDFLFDMRQGRDGVFLHQLVSFPPPSIIQWWVFCCIFYMNSKNFVEDKYQRNQF